MFKRFLRSHLPLFIGLIIGLVGVIGLSAGIVETWTLRATDRFFLERKTDPRIVIIAIDDASLGRIGRWPWPRTVHAALIQKLKQAGVRVVGMDVNFPEPSDAASDQALADALLEAGNVILPIELPLRYEAGQIRYDPNGVVQPITVIQSAAKTVGHTNTPLDADGVVRRVPLFVTAPDHSRIRAFVYEMATEVLGSASMPIIPTDSFGRLIINYPGAPTASFRTVSAADVIQGKIDLGFLKDAIVFVGATAHDLHDEQYVPTSNGIPMSGVEIHAALLDTILGRHWLVPLPWWIESLFLVLIGLILAIVVPRARARTSTMIAIGIWIAWIVAAFIAFDRGFLVDIVWPTLVLLFAYVVLIIERWADTEKRRRELRQAFGRYVSGSVVEAILRDPRKLKLGGDRRRMSVLFSDLRGFTTLSEGLAPEKLVEVLNKYLTAMTEIVFEEVGVLDKYIGDAVMAFWNAPFDQTDHAVRAVRTAVRMKNRLNEMNRSGMFPSGIVLKVGIGVNTGEMVVGNIGGEMRYDYTVIGDSVNLASRVESLNKEYTTEILVTEATLLELGDLFAVRKLDKVAVKGKKEPITLYEVMGMANQVSDAERKLAKQFETALEAYFDRRFQETMAIGAQILAVWPDDAATKHLLERCNMYLTNPPPAGWDGTWVMMKK